uniref:T9SS type A sorting domain-containing protein n=1 Tax=Flavobacterium sp. TaxID=239 RepID=UPI00404AA8EF
MIFTYQKSFGQCPPTGGSHPAEGTFGTSEWIAYVYNVASYNNSSFVLTDYRGYYTDAGYGTDGINFDSSSSWGISSNPSTAATFQGTCSVTDNLHIVRYMREGFPCDKYQIDLAGSTGSAGHDDAVKVFIDGIQVYANTGCCSARINIWTGYLGPDSQVEMIWAENGGQSYGRMRFVPQTIDILSTSSDIIVCPGETYELTASSGSGNYDWSTNTTYVTGATDASTLTLDIPADAPNSTQVYTVETTESSTGCVFSKDITVTIDNTESPVVSATPSSITHSCYTGNSSTDVEFFGAITYSVLPTTGVTVNNASGSSVTFNPTETTTYTVTGTTGCGSGELTFTVTIPEQQGDPTEYGDNEWNLYGYSTGNFETYAGFYTISSLNFDTSAQWSTTSTPSAATGYLGCTIPIDNHSYKIKRQGFTCGFYQIDIPAHDDNVQLIIDGVLEFSQTSWYANLYKTNVWQGYLDSDSTIEMTIREQGGSSIAALTFIRLSDPVDVSQKVWTGKVNNNFNTAGNWCENSVPLTTDNIYVHPNAENDLVINIDTQINDITIGTGATMTIASGITFTVDGDIENNGSLTGTSGILLLSGSVAQEISGNGIEIDEFEIDNSNGVTINLDASENIIITSILRVTSGTLTTDDSIYLACEMGVKTAQVDQVSGSISGNVTTEQCYPGLRAFRFITSSVNTSTSIRANWQENATLWNDDPNPGYGTHITGGGPSIIDGFNGFDKSPSGAASMFTFDNATQAWGSISNTSSTNLVAGVPYRFILRGSRSVNLESNSSPASDTRIRATGELETGSVVVNSLADIEDGYSFVGNPYHAQVDMNSVLSAATNVANFLYVWDPNLGTRGAYVNINTSTDASSNGSSDANRFLQPYQAVFVRTIADGAASLTFNESDKAVNETQTAIFRVNSFENAFISALLYSESAYNNNQKATDGFRIDFNQNETNDINQNDSFKVFNPDENLSVSKEDVLLSLENRNYPSGDEVVSLRLTNYKTTNYVFKITVENLTEVNTFLFDKFTNEIILLVPNQVNIYNFSVDSTNELSLNPERFDIIFENIPLNNEVAEKQNFSIFPNPFENVLAINSFEEDGVAKLTITNMLGQKVYEKTVSFENQNQAILDDLSNLKSGTYFINIENNSNKNYNSTLIKR